MMGQQSGVKGKADLKQGQIDLMLCCGMLGDGGRRRSPKQSQALGGASKRPHMHALSPRCTRNVARKGVHIRH